MIFLRIASKRIAVFIVLCLLTALLHGQNLRKLSAGELHSFITQSDRPLVVCFWATWCSSCREEIPWLIKSVNGRFAGRVELLLVSVDAPWAYPGRIRSVIAERKYTAPVAWLSAAANDTLRKLLDQRWTGDIPAALMVNNANRFHRFYPNGLSELQVEPALELLLAKEKRNP